MTLDATQSTPNLLQERDPGLFAEVKEFRTRFEEMLLDDADDPRFRDRGHFLPRDDARAIAQVVRVLTSDSWTEDDLDRFEKAWRHAQRSEFFAETFESIRFRIEDAVRAARARLAERGPRDKDVIQGTLW